jgi:hypothetical protein
MCDDGPYLDILSKQDPSSILKRVKKNLRDLFYLYKGFRDWPYLDIFSRAGVFDPTVERSDH